MRGKWQHSYSLHKMKVKYYTNEGEKPTFIQQMKGNNTQMKRKRLDVSTSYKELQVLTSKVRVSMIPKEKIM